VAAFKTGVQGAVIGLDMTDAMLEKARANVEKSNLRNVKLVKGDATEIPLDDKSVDVVTSNGVLNLVPDKQKAFEEIFRVMKPGGRLQLSDIVTKKNVQAVCGIVPQLWADCIGGAAVENEYLEMIRNAGFVDVKVIDRVDYFSKSPESTRRLTETFGAESVVIAARKP
jgi:arsenite methyltransferase